MDAKVFNKLIEKVSKVPIEKLIELIVRTAVDQAVKSVSEEIKNK